MNIFLSIAHAADPACDKPGELTDPLCGADFLKLLDKIAETLVQIAIPVAVILFIWIGIQFFLAQGNSEKVGRAKKALLWTIVGLAVVIINKGFMSLIESILALSRS